MRKFVISNLYGDGKIYHSIMSYLENVSLEEDVELFINGDLIDWGKDSFFILKDVKEKIDTNSPISIFYLAGDHELMMYQALLSRKEKNEINPLCDWIKNGGFVFEKDFSLLNNIEEQYDELQLFLGNLDIYHIFEEGIYFHPFLLVHGKAPFYAKKNDSLKVKDNNFFVWNYTSSRRELSSEKISLNNFWKTDYKRYLFGQCPYFVIKGNDFVCKDVGFFYNRRKNYVNVERGFDSSGNIIYPLLEIEDNFLSFLLFTNKNEIVDAYVLNGSVLEKMDRDNFCEKNKVFMKKK